MTKFRPDIQGLRAIAVVLVLIYHIWPEFLPGGFVGVDVFFVLSGFLITNLLIKEVETTGSISFVSFYLNRARRLLPAASVVLFFVACSVPLLPATLWRETRIQVLASAFYIQNWRLADLSVDYLNAEYIGGSLQHFWSLAIEEQFYLIWPLLLWSVFSLGEKNQSRFRFRLGFTLAGLTVLSFVAGVFETYARPDQAYFLTHVRVWELALGGLIAIAGALPAGYPLSQIFRYTGLGLIFYSSFAFSSHSAFPGWIALLPTLGTAFLLFAPPKGRSFEARLLGTRPFQFLGDISYSLYLWHWPLIVFFALVKRDSPNLIEGLGLLLVSIVVAQLSKKYVEDPFRHRNTSRQPLWQLLRVSVVAVLLPVTALAAVLMATQQRNELKDFTIPSALYPGAKVLNPNHTEAAVFNVPPAPPLELVKEDWPIVYDNGCQLEKGESQPRACSYGKLDSNFEVYLVGDSHASSWVPTLEIIAEKNGWEFISHTKSSCFYLSEMASDDCKLWGKNLLSEFNEKQPEIIIFAQARKYATPDASDIAKEIENLWKTLDANGTEPVGLLDTPQLPFDPPTCLAYENSCLAKLSNTPAPDPIEILSREKSSPYAFIDMTEGFCQNGSCPAIIGNVVVWRDDHHFTSSYAKTLAPLFETKLKKAIDYDDQSNRRL